jgi:two-component system cell cycle response regulator DivK
MTAQVMPDDVARAEAAGFDGFLAKPLHFDRFPSNIRRLLNGERVWEVR